MEANAPNAPTVLSLERKEGLIFDPWLGSKKVIIPPSLEDVNKIYSLAVSVSEFKNTTRSGFVLNYNTLQFPSGIVVTVKTGASLTFLCKASASHNWESDSFAPDTIGGRHISTVTSKDFEVTSIKHPDFYGEDKKTGVIPVNALINKDEAIAFLKRLA